MNFTIKVSSLNLQWRKYKVRDLCDTTLKVCFNDTIASTWKTNNLNSLLQIVQNE